MAHIDLMYAVSWENTQAWNIIKSGPLVRLFVTNASSSHIYKYFWHSSPKSHTQSKALSSIQIRSINVLLLFLSLLLFSFLLPGGSTISWCKSYYISIANTRCLSVIGWQKSALDISDWQFFLETLFFCVNVQLPGEM